MFTRCPGCHTVHPVNAALLAQGGGRYRCGKCNRNGNALESLFDEWPEAGAKPVSAGKIPVLGLSIDLDQAARRRQEPGAADPSAEEASPHSPRRARRLLLRATWIVLAAAILGFTAWGLAEFLGKPLQELPGVHSILVKAGIADPPPRQPFRDLERIRLVSRELTTHPSEPGLLRFTATIVNRAPKSQPYPGLELILLDAEGQVLAAHRFTPFQYLARGSAMGSGMAPGAYLPLALDFDDPGEEAVGFELNFH